MTKKELKIVAIIIIIMIGVIGILFVKNNNNKNIKNEKSHSTVSEEFVYIEQDGTKVNKSDKLSESKLIDGLEISNITLIEKNGESCIQASVKNTTNETLGEEFIKLTLIDKQQNTLSVVKGYLEKIPGGETFTLNIKANSDFANAYDFIVSK